MFLRSRDIVKKNVLCEVLLLAVIGFENLVTLSDDSCVLLFLISIGR